MNRCATCKHWERGTKCSFPQDATYIDGTPHKSAGQVTTDRPGWDAIKPGQDVGWCTASGPDFFERQTEPLMMATDECEGIYANLVTDAKFGCILHTPADPAWDHYRHITYYNLKRKPARQR